jgi:hypothetical protein
VATLIGDGELVIEAQKLFRHDIAQGVSLVVKVNL